MAGYAQIFGSGANVLPNALHASHILVATKAIEIFGEALGGVQKRWLRAMSNT